MSVLLCVSVNVRKARTRILVKTFWLFVKHNDKVILKSLGGIMGRKTLFFWRDSFGEKQ